MQMIGNGTYELGVGTVEAGGVMVTVSRGKLRSVQLPANSLIRH